MPNALNEPLRKTVNSHFEECNPFPVASKNIEGDIEQFIKIVGYCLDVGDTELLDTWVVKAIQEDPCVLSSQEYDLYFAAVKTWLRNAEVDLEIRCVNKILDMFQILNQDTIQRSHPC